MKNIETILKNLGLSEKEFLIYETLYKNGSMSVAEISKALNIPRTTIYQNVDNLLKKGLVAHTVKGDKKHIVAELPVRFETLVKENKTKAESKIKEIEQIEDALPQLLNHFSQMSPELLSLPQTDFKYYEGKDNVSRIYDDLLNYPIIKSYIDPIQIKEAFPENVDKFNKAMERGVLVYDLLTDKNGNILLQNNFKAVQGYNYKYFPAGTNIHYMDYLIYGDSISIVQGGSKPSALVINNKLLAANAKTIYDVLWNLLPEPDDQHLIIEPLIK